MALKKRRKNAAVRRVSSGTIALDCKECGRYCEVDADTKAITCAYCTQRLVDPPLIKPKADPDAKKQRGRPRKIQIKEK
jgi:hypothetical protein